MKPETIPDERLRLKRFLFNAVIGVVFIVAGSVAGLLGLIGIVSIIGFPQGIALLVCSMILYLCGARLIFGALMDE